MAKSTTTCNNLLKLLFNATAWANIADNAGASPLTNLYLSLHSADPGVGNNQTTNEVAYSNYQRIPIARSGSGWTVLSNGVSNAALAQFAQCGITGATARYVAIGTNASPDAGNVLYAGQLNADLAISNGIQPQFALGALTVTET
jgi:hypothetical protein